MTTHLPPQVRRIVENNGLEVIVIKRKRSPKKPILACAVEFIFSSSAFEPHRGSWSRERVKRVADFADFTERTGQSFAQTQTGGGHTQARRPRQWNQSKKDEGKSRNRRKMREKNMTVTNSKGRRCHASLYCLRLSFESKWPP